VALARMTPAVRIVAIASSAIAGVPARSFALGLIVGNAVFLTGHFLLGVVLGEPAVKLVGGAGTGLIAAGIGLALIGGAGWWIVARRRARARSTDPGQDQRLAVLDWTDACCPACLALALVRPANQPADAA